MTPRGEMCLQRYSGAIAAVCSCDECGTLRRLGHEHLSGFFRKTGSLFPILFKRRQLIIARTRKFARHLVYFVTTEIFPCYFSDDSSHHKFHIVHPRLDPQPITFPLSGLLQQRNQERYQSPT
eukprot:Gregarina_sp_Poly_1__1723@NODE_1444_length_4133_cov_160_835957_g144_i1_p7_GENE_NODE_1444_length_4133_cov_160_835957_g144_i1NODE_1444_length_4133_cov_160_835957_g144_i1_p7_ORF_typecomplete_len123_score9_09DUF5365/PF17326_2/0_23_NODE_1444_length_4133_cov_160_835957_g144_i119402308